MWSEIANSLIFYIRFLVKFRNICMSCCSSEKNPLGLTIIGNTAGTTHLTINSIRVKFFVKCIKRLNLQGNQKPTFS